VSGLFGGIVTQAANGREIQVDIVPAEGMDGDPYRIMTVDKSYVVVLNEETWLPIINGAALGNLNPEQIVFLMESWFTALVNEWIDARS
jgi:hypothetical protein